MEFHSLAFLAFLLFVFTTFWLLPWPRVRVWLLLAASFWFYATWSRELALLVTTTSIMDYVLARAIEAAPTPRRRKLLLAVSLGVNLGLLAYFKYTNFFLESLEAALKAAGLGSHFGTLQILAPFGISFYTFEAISYTMDVYRGRMKAERSLPSFMLFILFFPHLVSGPIVRAWDFLPQTHRVKRWSWYRLSLGMQLFALGLFKKVALGDFLAQFSDPVFTNPTAFGTGPAWLGLFAFAMRVYCDFSGYSDMALGTAHLFGYKLTWNFNLPFVALNMSEFWRRWHISLSTWLRDYIFIPLGGSRGSSFRADRNLMITMVLGGFWHGANWSYVLFGAMQGSFLIIHRHFRAFCDRRPAWQAALDHPLGRFARRVTTFMTFTLSLIFFQPSLDNALSLAGRLFAFTRAGSFDLPRAGLWIALALVVIGYVLVDRAAWQALWTRLPTPLRGALCAGVGLAAILLMPGELKPFIYFQF